MKLRINQQHVCRHNVELHDKYKSIFHPQFMLSLQSRDAWSVEPVIPSENKTDHVYPIMRNLSATRKHSSRMRTTRLPTVSCCIPDPTPPFRGQTDRNYIPQTWLAGGNQSKEKKKIVCYYRWLCKVFIFYGCKSRLSLPFEPK